MQNTAIEKRRAALIEILDDVYSEGYQCGGMECVESYADEVEALFENNTDNEEKESEKTNNNINTD